MKLRSGRHAALALATFASLGACATTDQYGYEQPPQVNKEAGGTVAGAIAGGAAGALLDRGNGASVLIGALLGGIVGNRVGASADERDRRMWAEAEYRSFDSGAPSDWRNPDTGNYGRVVPRDAYDRGGETCREYESEVYIRGRHEVLTGLACRDRDGRWRDVSNR